MPDHPDKPPVGGGKVAPKVKKPKVQKPKNENK
jgi:hypothetical protein